MENQTPEFAAQAVAKIGDIASDNLLIYAALVTPILGMLAWRWFKRSAN